MPKITFITPNGEQQILTLNNCITLMEAAKRNGVDGILAECGGSCACGTCHVFIDASYSDKIPAPDEYEKNVLEETAIPQKENSRLSCQIRLTDELDGMVVTIAAEQ